MSNDITKQVLNNVLGGMLDEKISSEADEPLEKVASYTTIPQDPYPSPFLNLSDTAIPDNMFEMFQWCRYYYTFDPLINGAINALATFPVTDVALEDSMNSKESNGEDKSDTLKIYEKVILDKIKISKLLVEMGIDYFLYGNCFIFGEMHRNKVTDELEWKSMVRLDPNKMTIDHNPATHELKYKWDIPDRVKRIIKAKEPADEYEKIPEYIRKAALENKSVVINPLNIYHLKRPGASIGEGTAWGTPIVANVLKLLMYRNTLRQAQEAIAKEHIVPMRVFYLDSTNTYNVETNWNNIADSLAKQLQQSVRDPNHKIVSPVPLNMINVGGEGRALLLTPEIEQIQGEILAGMNVPREFLFGGVSYSGSSISLRILENQFITYRLMMKDFLQNFVVKNMAKARKEWVDESDDDSLVTVKLMDLKMQDDVQQKQIMIQLNNAGKCTDETLWKTLGLDPEKMKETLKKEALEAAEMKAELQKAELQAKLDSMDLEFEIQKKQMEQQMQLQMYQQSIMGEQAPQQGTQPMEQGGQQQNGQPQKQQSKEAPQQTAVQAEPLPTAANPEEDPQLQQQMDLFIKNIQGLPDADINSAINKLPVSIRSKILEKMNGGNSNNVKNEVDMRPAPEQKPPRRDGGV